MMKNFSDLTQQQLLALAIFTMALPPAVGAAAQASICHLTNSSA